MDVVHVLASRALVVAVVLSSAACVRDSDLSAGQAAEAGAKHDASPAASAPRAIAVVDAGGAANDASDAGSTHDSGDASSSVVVVDPADPRDGVPDHLEALGKACAVVLERNARAFTGLQGETYAGGHRVASLNALCWPRPKSAWGVLFGDVRRRRDAGGLVVDATYRVMQVDAQGAVALGAATPVELTSTEGVSFVATPSGDEILPVVVTHLAKNGNTDERLWFHRDGASLVGTTKPPSNAGK